MNILGIDPGATGALVIIGDDRFVCADMPVHEIKKGKSKRKRLDPYGLATILRSEEIDHAFIEKVAALPKSGSAQAFTFGWMAGGIETALAVLGVPFTYVTPQKWKKELKCPREKDGARMRASQLMPQHSENWRLKKHDGRAEAALIAYYGTHAVKGGAVIVEVL